jgi:putative transposase
VHIVWATTRRAALITPVVETGLYECLRDCAKRGGVTVMAAGGSVDHVHIVVRLPGTVSVAAIVKQMKGVSSRFVNET